MYRQTDRQTDRQTRQRDRQTDKTERQTDRQTDKTERVVDRNRSGALNKSSLSGRQSSGQIMCSRSPIVSLWQVSPFHWQLDKCVCVCVRVCVCVCVCLCLCASLLQSLPVPGPLCGKESGKIYVFTWAIKSTSLAGEGVSLAHNLRKDWWSSTFFQEIVF